VLDKYLMEYNIASLYSIRLFYQTVQHSQYYTSVSNSNHNYRYTEWL